MILPSLFIASIWGVTPLLQKEVLKHMSLEIFLILSSIFLATCAIVFALVSRRKGNGTPPKTPISKYAVVLVITVAVLLGIGQLIFLRTIKKHDNHTPAIVALTHTAPLFTLLFFFLIFRKRVHAMTMLGVLLTSIGIAMISYFSH
jgi:drug/metabolite transporter (DMT)-like permease